MAEADTKEVEALLAALNRSAERLQTLWFSFMGVTLYFAIQTLNVTHRMLLLNEPQGLPIVNLKVPLLPFFVIAPLFYLVLHFYLLMMLVLLARTAHVFEQRLEKAIPGEAERERFRARGENSLVLQMLVGRREEREGMNGRLLSAIAVVTLAITPVATLLLMQLMFLPYHSFRITWEHRVVVLLSLVATVFLWTCWRRRWGTTPKPNILEIWAWAFKSRERTRFGWLYVSIAVLAAFELSFWEGRWAGEPYIGRADYATPWCGAAACLFSDRLIIRNESIVGWALFRQKREESEASGATRIVPTLRVDSGRDFQAADFSYADLRGMLLAESDLRSAVLNHAQLWNADMSKAQLQGALLVETELQGSHLENSNFHRANFHLALLQGADFAEASLHGADLSWAKMHGADFFKAKMRGADFRGAQMQGVNLQWAELQGANLTLGVQLQGSELAGANLEGADLSEAYLSRADAAMAIFGNTNLSLVHTDKVLFGNSGIRSIVNADIDEWASKATEHIIDVERAKQIKAHLDFLKLVEIPGFDARASIFWSEKIRQSPSSSTR